MRPLVWIRIRQKVRGMEGLLVLLLAILILSSLKFVLSGPGTTDVSHDPGIFVQIDGDVRHPGIYSFPREPDLGELMARCGGLRQGRDLPRSLDMITLQSGDRISVKTEELETSFFPNGISAFHRITLGLPISLNMESEEGLTAIPGIGPSLAGVIVSEREKRGGFRGLDEIKSLPGIGDRKYRKIEPYITL